MTDQTDFGGADIVGWGVGPVLEKFSSISRIVVLRGGGLGDLMFALPAVSALKAAYPGATITLLGTPGHAELFQSTLAPVQDVRILPFAEGVRPGAEDTAATGAFFGAMRRERFDLAVQLHGGGRFSNPFLLRLGARHSVGTRTPDAALLERCLPYVYYQHEPLRALEVVGLAGAAPVELEARLRPRAGYTARAEEVLDSLPGSPNSPVVALHPGATDPRRRWSVNGFAEVAAACAADGNRVLVIGTAAEANLASAIVQRSGSRSVLSLAGALDLGTLTAVLDRCHVLLGNDSGPRHLAQALGTPTVGIYWAGNMINASPLGRSQHRTHLSWVTRCPECGADVTQVGWTSLRCPHDVSLMLGIDPDEVYRDVRYFTARTLLPRDR